MIDLHLQVKEAGLAFFLPLLEKGVLVPARTGCSIRDFFCGQLGLPADYLDQRIQTLFLNARPVDNVDKALIQDGSTLALSAAMPGLLGATMRKDGWYAAFRREISQPAPASALLPADGLVRLKLFNMVAREIGGRILQRGVRIDGADLKRLYQRHDKAMTCHIQRVQIAGHPVASDDALLLTLADQPVELTITVG